MNTKSRLILSVLTIAVVLGAGAVDSKAQMAGGVNFGTAGPQNWGLLAVGGSGAAGFGSHGTQVSINGPGAGVYGSGASLAHANVGIAGTGQASGWGGGNPQPTIDGTLYYTSNNTGINTNGVTVVGGEVENNSLLATAASDASTGLSDAEALPCTGSENVAGAVFVPCGGQINSSSTNTTIYVVPVNQTGQNVLDVSQINLGNGDTLFLGGTNSLPSGACPSTTPTWVIRVSGNLTLNSAAIKTGNCITGVNVLIIVEGNVSTSGGLNNESRINAVVVVPTGTAHFSPGLVDPEVIVGGNQVTFVSGGSIVISPGQ